MEAEQALAGHPDIADVAIVGQPREVFGEQFLKHVLRDTIKNEVGSAS